MSSEKHCCVPGCKEKEGAGQVLHGFPNPEKDKSRFNAWLYAIGGDILALENEKIYKRRRVCHLHFEDKYLCRYNKISNIAVPTINLPGLLSPRHTSRSFGIRNPMQQISDLNEPSTSDKYLTDCDAQASMILAMDVSEKENIGPATLVQRQEALDIFIPKSSAINTGVMSVKDPETPGSQRNTKGSMRTLKKNFRKISFSKTERKMYKEIVHARIKISKMKNKIKKQSAHIKAAKKFSNNPSAILFENSTSTAKLLMQLQLRENKKKEKGRRFTIQEKISSLSIYKQSPKGYRFLRNIFVLPNEQTLFKLLQRSNLKPGLNKKIFTQLKSKAQSMNIQDKLVVLLFDEMSIKANVTFRERKDQIIGLVDNGHERNQEFADHALVFMLRGVMKNYKQPVYYTFSKSATKGPELARQIKEVTTSIQEAGLTVVATICDQGANNRQALKLLVEESRAFFLRNQNEPKDNIIIINNQEIVPLYDPPHLVKGMRNNLLNKNLQYVAPDGITKTAKWSHLHLLLKENPGYKGVRLIPNLTENHIHADKINKMKVKYATQIFSRTVASNMGYLADKGILPEECKETADLLLFMDNIFDSVNGSYSKNKFAKPLLGPATPNSFHHKIWKDSKKVFRSMVFINSDGKKEYIPTVTNWMWTLNGIEILLKKLEADFDITSVWLRHLNQDPLENFFGAVRCHGCRNINPTCDQFESAFTTLLINNLNSVHIRGTNCESDFCNALHSLIIDHDTNPTPTCSYDFRNIFDFEFTALEVKENDPKIIAPLQYMSGYFLKMAKAKIFKTCDKCIRDLSSSEEIEYIKYREYAGRRWLCTPSKSLIKLISEMQDIINKFIKESFEKPNIKEIIKTVIIVLIDFSFMKCDLHKNKLIDYLIESVTRCLIYNYCKNINQILAGRRQVDDDDDSLQIKAINKCKKRLR